MELPRTTTIARELEKLLLEECMLYAKHSEVVNDEYQNVIKFNADQVQSDTGKREEMLSRLAELQKRRIVLMEQLHFGVTTSGESAPRRRARGELPRLSDLVTKHLDANERAKIDPLILQLKSAVLDSRRSTLQFSQLTGFALNMVNGLLSTVWSAAENVVQSYGPRGRTKQSYNPTASRRQNVIKEV